MAPPERPPSHDQYIAARLQPSPAKYNRVVQHRAAIQLHHLQSRSASTVKRHTAQSPHCSPVTQSQFSSGKTKNPFRRRLHQIRHNNLRLRLVLTENSWARALAALAPRRRHQIRAAPRQLFRQRLPDPRARPSHQRPPVFPIRGHGISVSPRNPWLKLCLHPFTVPWFLSLPRRNRSFSFH